MAGEAGEDVGVSDVEQRRACRGGEERGGTARRESSAEQSLWGGAASGTEGTNRVRERRGGAQQRSQ